MPTCSTEIVKLINVSMLTLAQSIIAPVEPQNIILNNETARDSKVREVGRPLNMLTFNLELEDGTGFKPVPSSNWITEQQSESFGYIG